MWCRCAGATADTIFHLTNSYKLPRKATREAWAMEEVIADEVNLELKLVDGKIEKFINIHCLHKKNIHDESRPESSQKPFNTHRDFSKFSGRDQHTILHHRTRLLNSRWCLTRSHHHLPHNSSQHYMYYIWILNLKNKRWRVDWSMDKTRKEKREEKTKSSHISALNAFMKLQTPLKIHENQLAVEKMIFSFIDAVIMFQRD